MARHVLILGGTAEARQLALRLADRTDISVTISLAGRTASPLEQPVPARFGGFGGASGLAQYLQDNRVFALIDATHPYAANVSANAVHAATQAGTPLLALARPPWKPTTDDRWIDVADAREAVRTLGSEPQNVFLAMGRQEIAAFALEPHHRYLVRSVDPVSPPLPVPFARYILARGPFDEISERELLSTNNIDVIVSKNSGGAATYGKIEAARALGIPVLMLRRPPAPAATTVSTIAAAADWLDHLLAPAIARDV